MADGNAQSRYVKLTKEQGLSAEISPGELYQPIDVPELVVHKCCECGQPLPVSYQPPTNEDWTSGICGCADDPESCWTGLFCPCVLFGRNVEKMRDDFSWRKACICHAFFVEGGIALAIGTAAFHGFFVDPSTVISICEALLFGWWLCGIHAGLFRQTLQKKYHLKNSPCSPCLVHCCMHWCAICQEHREMGGRISEEGMTPMTVVKAPPIQVMDSSENDAQQSAPLPDEERTNLEMQPV